MMFHTDRMTNILSLFINQIGEGLGMRSSTGGGLDVVRARSRERMQDITWASPAAFGQILSRERIRGHEWSLPRLYRPLCSSRISTITCIFSFLFYFFLSFYSFAAILQSCTSFIHSTVLIYPHHPTPAFLLSLCCCWIDKLMPFPSKKKEKKEPPFSEHQRISSFSFVVFFHFLPKTAFYTMITICTLIK